MTPTLPTDLISAGKLLECLAKARRMAEHFKLRDVIACLDGIEAEAHCGLLSPPAPAVHSADGLLDKLYESGIEQMVVAADRSLSLAHERFYAAYQQCILELNTRHQGAGWMPVFEELFRYASLHAMDSLISEGDKIIGWQKTETFSRLLDRCKKALPTAPGQSPASDEVWK